MLYGILGLIIIVLIILLTRKIKVDNEIKLQVEKLKFQKENLQNDIRRQVDEIESYNRKVLEAQRRYDEEFNKKKIDLDKYFNEEKQKRQTELEAALTQQEELRQINLENRMRQLTKQAQDQVDRAEVEARGKIEKWEQAQEDIATVTLKQEERYNALLGPILQYEKEKQDRLFYTIQVPEEYKEDIDFLLTTVAARIQHPDIINKLVWAEYVKPYIDGTFKRAGIVDKPGIYKITNINTNKCYIGKSTNLKKRIIDHFKSAVGIQSIADQAVHHAILKEGYWNWLIEPIIYCEKDELNDLEKYYINFFQSNIYGYNKTGGGEG